MILLHGTSNKLAKIDELIMNKGVEGLKILFLFKLLKAEVLRTLREQQVSLDRFSEKTLENMCLEKALQLVKSSKEKPSLQDIREIMLSLPRPRKAP